MEELQGKKIFPEMIKIIIINGKGGCGKDTMISECKQYFESIVYPSSGIPECKVYNLSSIDHVKKMLTTVGITENKKDPKYRKLLSDMKNRLDQYGDISSSTVIQNVMDLKMTYDTPPATSKTFLIFIHVREIDQITEMSRIFKMMGFDCSTLLVTSSITDDITYGNAADDGVDSDLSIYDKTFENGGTIEESGKVFTQCIHDLFFRNLPDDDVRKYHHNLKYTCNEPADEEGYKYLAPRRLMEVVSNT